MRAQGDCYLVKKSLSLALVALLAGVAVCMGGCAQEDTSAEETKAEMDAINKELEGLPPGPPMPTGPGG
jgi:hypothetical protein